MKALSAYRVARSLICLLAASLFAAAGGSAKAQTVLFSTGFEVTEDYLQELTLTGQNGWVGTAADGIVTNFFEGFGQQAYIGFARPADDTNDAHSVFIPINLAPVPAAQSLVKFSVRMQIADSSSTNGPRDDFRWSIYNTNGDRLFSLDFDNDSLLLSYVLDDGAFVSADVQFDNLGSYDLVLAMNFARNTWTATLNDEVVVDQKPITTTGRPLNLGDVDAVWVVRNPTRPGDNYMLFDDYTITAEPAPPTRPKLEVLRMRSGGTYEAKLHGEPGLRYRIESSTDLVNWTSLLTFTAPPNGILEFQDPTARQSGFKFYRARQGQ